MKDFFIKILRKLLFKLESDRCSMLLGLEKASTSIILQGTEIKFATKRMNRVYVKIGERCLIKATFLFETEKGKVIVGNNVHIGSAFFICRTSVIIDDDVTMAWGITIYDHNSHSIYWEGRKNDNYNCYQDYINNEGNNIINKDWSNVISKPIHICSKVWVGLNVTILKGVTIGEGAVVGACSVVTKDVEPMDSGGRQSCNYHKEIKMKILIIGCKGFIGSHVLAYFSSTKNVECWGADVVTDYTAQHYFLIDSTNSDYSGIFENHQFDVCINCSGAASVPDSLQHTVRDFSLNTYNVIRLLDVIRKYNSDCFFINLSSAAVYGNQINLPINESAVCKPVSPYGLHKLMAEQICNEYYQYFEIATCTLRIFSAFGPGIKKAIVVGYISEK